MIGRILPIVLLFVSYLSYTQPPNLPLQNTSPETSKYLELGRKAHGEKNYLVAEEQYLKALALAKEVELDLVIRHLDYLFAESFQYQKWEPATIIGTALSISEVLEPVYVPFDLESDTLAFYGNYLSILEANPQHYRVLFEMAQALDGIPSRRGEALDYYRRAIAAKPDLWEARYLFSQVLLAINQFPEAEVHLQALVDRWPENLDYQIKQYWLYHLWNRWSKREEVLRNMLRLDSNNPFAVQFLAKYLHEQGRYVEVEEFLKNTYYQGQEAANLASTLLIRYYQENATRYPEKLQFLYKLAQHYWEIKKPEEGVRTIQELLDKQPNYAGYAYLNFQLGTLHNQLGQHAEAIPPLELATREMNPKTDAQFQLIDAYAGAQQYSQALSLLKEVQAEVGLDYKRELQLAHYLVLSGELEKGIQLAQEIIDYYPNNRSSGAWRVMARGQALQGNYADALISWEEVVQYEYDNGYDYYCISQLHLRSDIDKEKGLEWLLGCSVKSFNPEILDTDPYFAKQLNWEPLQAMQAEYFKKPQD